MASGYFKCIRDKSKKKIESILSLLERDCMTCRDVSLKLEIPEFSLKQYFSKLHMEEKIHIKGWRKQDINLVPVYSWGHGIDAPKINLTQQTVTIKKLKVSDKINELLISGSLSVTDIALTLNTDVDKIRYHIKKLKANKQIHISEWKQGPKQIIPIYSLGEGIDCEVIKLRKINLSPEEKLHLKVQRKIESGEMPGSKELLASFFWKENPNAARIVNNKQRSVKSGLH